MNVFRFENPAALQFFWLLPLLVALSIWFTRTHLKKMQNFFSVKLYPFLSASISNKKRQIKFILELLVIALFIIALARPQSGQSEEKVKSEGVELMILFDVSTSMMTEDIRPSRMDFAKKEMMKFLDLSGDRVGLVAFAGSAALLSPLTGDRNAMKMYIESLNTESVSSQGTDFKRALTEAKTAFERGGVEGDDTTVVTRAVVIVSDGEDNEQGAIDMASQLKDLGVRIFTLAVGTEKGGAIPIKDRLGNLRGYKKDKSGKVILSQTKGELLKNLAIEGGGSFHHLTYGGNALQNIRSELSKLEKAEFDSAVVVDYQENFQIFLFFGLLLGLIELVLGERRSRGRIWKGRFEVMPS